MFSLQAIREAHAKVKSGADFPAYVKELKKLGVSSYHSFVSDGHTDFFGEQGFHLLSGARYTTLKIAIFPKPDFFVEKLKAHQQGASSYEEFCQQAAEAGVSKWIVDTQQMTCTYLDSTGKILLLERF
ncbi:MAG: DUF1398 domain-containing protein [Chitinophagaceae bacterium]